MPDAPDAPDVTVASDAPTREQLEAAHCWEAADQVPRRPELTAFRRRVRYEQARWREDHGHPIGTQPIRPVAGKPARPVGSRMPLGYARETGANFVTRGALDAARARMSLVESHQSIDMQRLWADLLWAPALCFNLFGDLAAALSRDDDALGDRALHAWWPDAPGRLCGIRFLHSPGWLDVAYTGSLVAFDVAIDLDLGNGARGVLAVSTKYHDATKREVPKPARLARYVDIATRSRVFTPDVLDAVNGTDLLVMWLEHLLLLSMVQHPGEDVRWARYVVVHPAGNTGYADACARYGAVVADPSAFAATTLEAMIGAGAGALPRASTTALRDRYLR